MTRIGQALRCRQFQLPRQGHNPEECQDAAAVDPECGRFALADGASESPQAALWAGMLVESFAAGADHAVGWNDWLTPIQQRWADVVTPGPEQQPLPWYLEPGVEQGAFATLLGVVVKPDKAGSGYLWEALAVGDSCVFQTRGDTLVQAFPLARSGDFNNSPWLVGSRGAPWPCWEVHQGKAWPGDRLWLMTDALAQWFLSQQERGGKPWLTTECLLHEAAADLVFADWITALRRLQHLHNDDVTLIGVGFE